MAVSGSVPSLPPPRPKSPPDYPDLYGKRRELAKIQMMEREISFLEEELKSVEGLPAASRCCKNGMSCFSLSWICCCCNCWPLKCYECNMCSSNCGNPCANCQIAKCRCKPCNISCSSCWNSCQCFSKCKCSYSCCCSIPECPSCLTCPTIKCTCHPIRCSKFNICLCCCCSKNRCFASHATFVISINLCKL